MARKRKKMTNPHPKVGETPFYKPVKGAKARRGRGKKAGAVEGMGHGRSHAAGYKGMMRDD